MPPVAIATGMPLRLVAAVPGGGATALVSHDVNPDRPSHYSSPKPKLYTKPIRKTLWFMTSSSAPLTKKG